MSPAQAKNLEKRLSHLEKVVDVVLHQNDSDWLNSAKLVKKLDQLADTEEDIAEKDAGL